MSECENFGKFFCVRSRIDSKCGHEVDRTWNKKLFQENSLKIIFRQSSQLP